MPLIDITMKSTYEIRRVDGTCLDQGVTHHKIKTVFSAEFPSLLVEHAKKLGLDADTPAEGIQVMNHNYGDYDVNIANLWIKVQFSENTPNKAKRIEIRDTLYDLIVEWFAERGMILENFIMDLFWGPTNGRGTVDGVEIVW
jgi:hypothetical protein